MTMLFADSFDHYSTADIAAKWSRTDTAAYQTITSSAGRLGTNGLRITWPAIGGGSGTTPSYVSCTTSAKATLIVGFALQISALPAGRNRCVCAFLDSGLVQTTFYMNTDGTISGWRGFPNLFLGTTSAAVVPGVSCYLEFKVTCHNTAGAVIVRMDEVVRMTVSGVDTTQTALNQTTGFLLGQHATGGGDGNITTGVVTSFDYDDVVCMDTLGTRNNDFIGDARVHALLPTGAGNSTQFTPNTGNNYQCVNEVTPNGDTNYVSSNVVGQRDTYVYGDIPASGTVFGVIPQIYAKKTDAGSRSIAPVIRHSGVNYLGGNMNPGVGYGYLNQVFEVNPGTSAVFTPSEVNNCEFGEEVTV